MSTPQGTIYLLNNVPLTASYEHTIDFKKRDEQYSYFMKFLKKDLSNYTYIRKEREYIIAELSAAELDDINYLIFRSSAADRLYYAFVLDKIYVNEYTTQIFFSIDVLQTYQFDYKWQPSYIKQAHVDRWTAGHLPIYSKTEENLNYGSEYVVESAFKIQQSTRLRWLLVTLKDFSSIAITGAVFSNSKTFPLSSSYVCMLVPIYMAENMQTDKPINITNTDYILAGGGVIGNIGNQRDLAEYMLKSEIGNFITNISLLSYCPYVASEAETDTAINVTLQGAQFTSVQFEDGEDAKKYLLLYTSSKGSQDGNKTLAVTDWDTGLDSSLPTAEEWKEIKAKPRTTKRDKRWESKLLCSPYRYNILTDWRNSPTILKNEYMGDKKITIKYSTSLSYTAPFRYWIADYKRDIWGRTTCLTQALALEFPVLSDAYYTYLLENKNTIQANLTNSIINAGASVAQGTISGAATGGVLGAVGGAATGLVNGALNISAQIRSENAKQADLRMRPDSVLNATDSSFNFNDDNTELNFYRMRICCENEDIIAHIFNMSGYTINRVELPNTRSRVRFNYLQTVGANIIGSFNQAYLERIKAIFDKGVTIWHYSEKDFNFLDYSYENIEVNLI